MSSLTTSPVSIAILVGLIIALGLYFFMTRQPSDFGKLPGPPTFPFVGTYQLFQYNPFKLHQFFTDVTRKYGPLVRVSIGTRKLVVITDAEAAKHILTTPTEFCRDNRLQSIWKGIAKYALFLIPNTESDWKKHRKCLQPSFGPLHLRKAVEITNDQTNILTNYIRQELSSNGECVLNVHEYFSGLTLDIIGLVAFSYKFHTIESLASNKHAEGYELMDQLMKTIQQRFIKNPFLWEYYGLGDAGTAAPRNFLYGLVEQLLKSKREAKESGDAASDKKEFDVMDHLLDIGSSGNELFSDEEIRDEIIGFFIAGHETTANSLTMLMMELAQHPQIVEKIRDELSQVNPDGNNFSWDDLASLKYLEMVIKEGMRLHPVVGAFRRVSVKNVQVMNYKFPKGVGFMVHFRALHRDPRYWTDPQEFKPERWEKQHVPGSYLPFGDGPTNCIGQKLAMLEIKLVVAHLLSKYNVSLLPGQDLSYTSTFTTGLKQGLQVQFESI